MSRYVVVVVVDTAVVFVDADTVVVIDVACNTFVRLLRIVRALMSSCCVNFYACVQY